MKNSTARLFVVLLCTALFLGCAIFMRPVFRAAYADDETAATCELLIDDDGIKFDGNVLNYVAERAGFENAQAMAIAAKGGTVKTAADFCGESGEFTVTFCGLNWIVAYLSKSVAGEATLTLWLAESVTTCAFVGGGTHSTACTSTASNWYDTSYMRSVGLNVGNNYATYEDKYAEDADMVSGAKAAANTHAFYMFTDSAAPLAQFICTPQSMSWQNASTAVGCSEWLTDMLWLPSSSEVCACAENSNRDGGLWQTSQTQRSDEYKTALRTKYNNSCWHVACIDGANTPDTVGQLSNYKTSGEFAVRPAFNLNLSKALLNAVYGCEHDLQYYEAVEATCVSGGNVGYYVCNNCGEYFADEGAANQISYDSVITSVNPDAHNFGDEYSTNQTHHWLECGRDQTHIDSYGEHVFSDWEYFDGGSHYKLCETCGYIEYESHVLSEWIIDSVATCAAAGVKHRACTVCSAVLQTENYTEQHTSVIDEAVAPTCTQQGYGQGSHCSVCGSVIVKPQVINPLGHVWGQWTAADKDCHESTCSVCGETRTEEHAFPEGGNTCTVCGYQTESTENSQDENTGGSGSENSGDVGGSSSDVTGGGADGGSESGDVGNTEGENKNPGGTQGGGEAQGGDEAQGGQTPPNDSGDNKSNRQFPVWAYFVIGGVVVLSACLAASGIVLLKKAKKGKH